MSIRVLSTSPYTSSDWERTSYQIAMAKKKHRGNCSARVEPRTPSRVRDVRRGHRWVTLCGQRARSGEGFARRGVGVDRPIGPLERVGLGDEATGDVAGARAVESFHYTPSESPGFRPMGRYRPNRSLKSPAISQIGARLICERRSDGRQELAGMAGGNAIDRNCRAPPTFGRVQTRGTHLAKPSELRGRRRGDPR